MESTIYRQNILTDAHFMAQNRAVPAYDHFVRLMNEAIDKRGIKRKWIAAKMGKSPSWISKVLKGQIDISLREAIHMIEVLQISTLEVTPSVLVGEDHPESVQDLVDRKLKEAKAEKEGDGGEEGSRGGS
jgi:ribosome-binding protein aMBF1 (putative translation factor)